MKHFLTLPNAAKKLQEGQVIAYPTEGVFGIGCDPFNADAVDRVLEIKRRPMEKGVILIADSLEQLRPYLKELSKTEEQRMLDSWPGPNTWVVEHNNQLPDWITGGRDTVAVRVSGHPIARELCRLAKMPLVSTSANLSGQPSLITDLEVKTELGSDIDGIVEGSVQQPGQASTIRDLATGTIYR